MGSNDRTRMVQVAKLDERGVYLGMTDIPEGELTDTHIHLKQGCDLPPGAYRWDEHSKTFVALEEGAAAEPADPNAVRAIAAGLVAVHDAGLTLPAETLRWLDFYISSTDFMGGFDDETIAMIKRFVARKGK